MIFWKYIKGLNQGSTGGTIPHPSDNTDPSLTPVTTSDERYTYIEFQPANNIPGNFTNAPWIYFTTGASGQTTHLGHIITSQATSQRIDTAFTFKKCVSFTNTTSGENSIDVSGLANFQDDIVWARGKTFSNSLGSIIKTYTGDNKILEIGSSGFSRVDIAKGVNIYGNLTITAGYHIYSADYIETGTYITAAGDITSGGKCEAVYFNATSDKRAKTNLKPLEINALDLINRVQLYSFKYKDSDLPSIGILAQDVQDVNIEGFDLVDNKQASGVDMDYMSIHESKLTYILWKAIQEQQKEIEELKTQIKNLTK